MAHRWYVVHTYSGHENKVCAYIDSAKEGAGLEEKIEQVVVPTEEVVEMKDGRKTTTQKKFLPSYVLERMEMDKDTLHFVTNVPGVTSFVGLVRDMAHGEQSSAMTLEHYPGMTEKMLAEIDAKAHDRWPLEASLIVHRYGRLEAGDRIVLVIAASPHRDAAFEACRFLIDWLKT